MGGHPDIPDAPVTLAGPTTPGVAFRCWVVEPCPYCGRVHKHGAGRKPFAQVQESLGLRVAHCERTRGTYRLVWNGVDRMTLRQAERLIEREKREHERCERKIAAAGRAKGKRATGERAQRRRMPR